MAEELEPSGWEEVDGVLDDRIRVPVLESETYDKELYARYKERVELASADSYDTFNSRREIVNYPFDPYADEAQIAATVRTIAMWGARYALGMMRNPDREADS